MVDTCYCEKAELGAREDVKLRSPWMSAHQL